MIYLMIIRKYKKFAWFNLVSLGKIISILIITLIFMKIIIDIKNPINY